MRRPFGDHTANDGEKPVQRANEVDHAQAEDAQRGPRSGAR